MSHFAAYVLVPEGTPDIEGRVDELLLPYFEGLEVPEYERECDCVRYVAMRKAQELATEKFGPAEDLRDQFSKTMEDREDADLDLEWAIFMKDYDQFTRDQYQRLVLLEPPDPTCEECNGTSRVMSTYNPASKWDWWEIGGRWSGLLDGSIQSLERASFDGAAVSLKDLDVEKLKIPFALVAPEGSWLEQGNMGMFARISFPDEQWDEKARRILEEHKDSMLVVVDCYV